MRISLQRVPGLLYASTEKRLQEIDRKTQNLLDAVERGVGLDTVLARLKELESEKKTIEQERSWVTVAERHLDPKEASSQAARFCGLQEEI